MTEIDKSRHILADETILPAETDQALAEKVRSVVMDLLEKHDDTFLVVAQNHENGSWISLDTWVKVQHEGKEIKYNLSISLEFKDGNLTKEVVTYSEPQPHFSRGQEKKPTCKITFFSADQPDEASKNVDTGTTVDTSPRVVISSELPIMPIEDMLDTLGKIDTDPNVKITAGRSRVIKARTYREHKAAHQAKPQITTPST